MCMWFGHYCQIIFFSQYFQYVNKVIFWYVRWNDWVLCERNTYNFIPIWYACCLDIVIKLLFLVIFNLWTYCHHCQIIFSLINFNLWTKSFFCISDAMIGYFVSATPLTITFWAFWKFTGILFMVWRIACGLFFSSFFNLWTLLVFGSTIWISIYIHSGCQFYTDNFVTLNVFSL